ncbi:MAG: carboxypeptidase-like regulatory domain-containing protein, partial [Gemmatimonadaceae bacterium]
RALPAQVVRLTVRDSVTKEVLTDAIVTLLDQGGAIAATGRTRSGGTLVLKPPAPGRYAFSVRKLGFAPATSELFDVTAGDTTRQDLTMRRIPQFLSEVAIRSERESIRNGRFFGLKIGTLSAAIISPTEVDQAVTGARDFTDLVARNSPLGVGVNFERRCVVSPPGTNACLPVIVDGLLTGYAADVVPPEVVDYILILRGNEIGVMYGTIGQNGAVVVFTKRGPKRGPREH